MSDLERMARKAGWPKEAGPFNAGSFSLEHFARLVLNAERRRVAQLSLKKRLARRLIGD